MGSYDTELSAYQLLRPLQGRYIPRFLASFVFASPGSTPLHPITNIVQGLIRGYIPGVSMEKLKPCIDVSEQEATRISSDVMAGLRAIEVANCLLHNDIQARKVVLREGVQSPAIIDFGEANIRQPGTSDED